ncbi:MAG: DNA-3-methyladenine glycosylase [bacterium]|nr:DNA-3-methyladenine glycosylase [bacterium]
MKKILRRDFFGSSAPIAAQRLLGKYLVRRLNGKTVAHKICETEAYHGLRDMASHARSGETARNAPMFGDAGTVYVYFTYGMHWMLNIVCGRKGYPSAVLIRGVEGISGPARLTRALHIDKLLNGKVLGKRAGLWIEDRGVSINPRSIERTPRIGVAHAGIWALKKWRFVLQGEE